MKIYKTFETERLFLRPTSIEDSQFIFDLLNSPKWIKYIGQRNINSPKEAENYIKVKMIPQLEKMGFSNYTVIRKEDQQKMGTCGLYNRKGIDGVDIGFAFLPDYEKKVYAYEAAFQIKQAAFEDFGLKKLNAITIKENLSSRKLIEKLGLTFVQNIRIPGDEEELMLYVIEAKK
ncbi:GNAT family N-acetyltransferase [Mesonia sp. K7]|uniref:GNAT family N-acetyltransferase n=1 Tax=Mesonia sp. K7 TaxID=2218606 RepID=UPI000DA8669B|nr:GNAT family N-acetyltransferase [Mesonia sp. K7]PZD79246.1 N-acetyltransferase [Mesonia sp. K7]